VIVDPATSCAIGVMAKSPQPGLSKTRLCPPLDPTAAAALSAAFLRDTTDNLAAAAAEAPIQAFAAYAPAGTETLLRRCLAPGTALILADGSAPAPSGVQGFGRALLQAMQSMLAEGYRGACVLSSDVPTLPTRLLVQAARALSAPNKSGRERAVFGACDDGGYYLLGATVAHPELFTDIAWSTDSVAATTRARIQALDLELVELDPWYDVDDAAALEVLLNETGGYQANATRAVIERLGLRELLDSIAA
jgi:rSAM/selenodomain-associated transferase 1